MTSMAKIAVLTAFALAAVPGAALAAPVDPIQMFVGHSRGHGILKVIFKKPQTVDVEGHGTIEKNGDLVLIQKVDDHSGPPRTRSWRIRKSGPSRYSGTMDDAVGPVSITLAPDGAHLQYVDHDGNRFEQLLVQRGPNEIINYLKVRKFGIVVARMTETIRKVD
jgi:hypothetical protein